MYPTCVHIQITWRLSEVGRRMWANCADGNEEL